MSGVEATTRAPTATVERGPDHDTQRRRARRRKALKPWLFLAPLLFFTSIVVLGPAGGSVYYAFTDWSGMGGADFVGLDNFRRMLDDRIFWVSLRNNLIWTAIFLTVPIGVALAAAALLAPIKHGQTFFRTLFFVPYVIASIVNAQIWRSLLDPQDGLGAYLAELGIPFADQFYFGNESIVLYSIAFVDGWHWWGFLLVLYLAAMQNVDHSLYEAARIDGAKRWQEFVHVTLPGIRPTIVFTLLISAIFSFLVFDYVWILTQGGPANASEVLATMSYKAAFTEFEAGYATAIALATSLICAIVALIFLGLRRLGWNV